MQLVNPIQFQDALGKLAQRRIVGSAPDFGSAQWSAVPVGLRERAFFSARVENARFLQRGKDSLTDFLAGNRETLPNGEVALKLGSRQEFVKQMQSFSVAEGMGPLKPGDAGTIKDITSEKRLGLIFDTQTRQAQDYGYWLQGQDPDVLDEFPAQRFIRVIDVNEPRTEHALFEDQVALKSDLDFWARINQDFGVPWGPWGWGCGHDVEDVDRAEAEQLGLLQPGQAAVPVAKSFNDALEASTQNLDPEMVQFLADAFGDQVEIDQAAMAVKWSATNAPVKPWLPVVPQPVPTKPSQGVATLDDALEAAGIKDQPKATAAQMQRLVDELREDQPLQASQVVKQVNAPTAGTMGENAVVSTVQEFLDFLPPQKAKALPKLTITVKHVDDQAGSYLGGNLMLDPYLSQPERRRVTFHELAHWLHMDGDPAYRELIKRHFRERTKGEKTAALQAYSYVPGVSGRKDRWYDEYAGRIYGAELGDGGDGVGLEVPTRYLELLSDPDKLAKYWSDPTNGASFRETFLIVLRGLF
jgi:hypothetical protein